MKTFESLETINQPPIYIQNIPNTVGYPVCWFVLILMGLYITKTIHYLVKQ